MNYINLTVGQKPSYLGAKSRPDHLLKSEQTGSKVDLHGCSWSHDGHWEPPKKNTYHSTLSERGFIESYDFFTDSPEEAALMQPSTGPERFVCMCWWNTFLTFTAEWVYKLLVGQKRVCLQQVLFGLQSMRECAPLPLGGGAHFNERECETSTLWQKVLPPFSKNFELCTRLYMLILLSESR